MTAFYNEVDPYAAAWLRNLIAMGEIAPGVVDERDIRDIRPDELTAYTQCHFFAGIGVWSYALRQAGWSDDRPIWTGSCPCQPFSAAGARGGFDDERHLWPHWHWLIAQCRPPVVVGEQVASKDGLSWLDLVSSDLEASGYAFGASDLCAAGVGGAHIRQRLYFTGMADANGEGGGSRLCDRESAEHRIAVAPGRRRDGRLADADGGNTSAEREQCGGQQRQQPQDGGALRVADADDARLEGRSGVPERADQCAAGPGGLADSIERRSSAPMLGRHAADWLFCRDGKWRPVEPGTFPLAHAAPARVGRLRAYGNALDAETATTFVQGVMDSTEGMALLG